MGDKLEQGGLVRQRLTQSKTHKAQEMKHFSVHKDDSN